MKRGSYPQISPPDVPRHPEQIKAAVRMRGSTLRELSRRAGLNQNACSIALGRPWPAVERIIAKFLRVRPEQIWPERYRDGKPIRGGWSTRVAA